MLRLDGHTLCSPEDEGCELDPCVSSLELAAIRDALTCGQTIRPLTLAEGRACVEETLKLERSRRLGLMLCAEAQNTQVVHLKGFMGDGEIEELLAVVAQAQEEECVGVIQRGVTNELLESGAWRTSFLHTNGFFEANLPHLRHKLRQAIEDADAEHWQLLDGRARAALNFRTIECHEYSAGGRLAQAGHYDEGSLITMDVMLAEPGVDFGGGAFVAPLADGTLARPEFRKGDAVLFVSHKVRPLTVTRCPVGVTRHKTHPAITVGCHCCLLSHTQSSTTWSRSRAGHGGC
jgi:hypothetical protein